MKHGPEARLRIAENRIKRAEAATASLKVTDAVGAGPAILRPPDDPELTAMVTTAFPESGNDSQSPRGNRGPVQLSPASPITRGRPRSARGGHTSVNAKFSFADREKVELNLATQPRASNYPPPPPPKAVELGDMRSVPDLSIPKHKTLPVTRTYAPRLNNPGFEPSLSTREHAASRDAERAARRSSAERALLAPIPKALAEYSGTYEWHSPRLEPFRRISGKETDRLDFLSETVRGKLGAGEAYVDPSPVQFRDGRPMEYFMDTSQTATDTAFKNNSLTQMLERPKYVGAPSWVWNEAKLGSAMLARDFKNHENKVPYANATDPILPEKSFRKEKDLYLEKESLVTTKPSYTAYLDRAAENIGITTTREGFRF